jgi:sulfotransferase
LNNGIHFISGLPRAGSTLLSALLLQNPKLLAGITSPVGALVASMLERVSQGNETAVGIDDGQREALLRRVRQFLSRHPPDAHGVRHQSRLDRADEPAGRAVSGRENHLLRSSHPLARADALMAPNGMVGYALQSLKQAMHSDESDRLLLLPYDLLVSDPERAMRAVYDFTGLPHYQHDFAGVSFDATEFDARLGTPGLHKVLPQVAQTERATLLPPTSGSATKN